MDTSSKPPLISDQYRRLNLELHSRVPTYGTTGRRYVEVIRKLAIENNAQNILDYGCGKRDLWNALHDEFDVREFDPAVSGFEAMPEPADLVACIDVLEHVEPVFLENVLRDLARVTLKIAFLTIATRSATKMLADGSNCHRIIQPGEWWLDQLRNHFAVIKSESTIAEGGIQVVVRSVIRTESG